ncbi:MAG: hypothetical protein QXZ36_03765, partial [Thermoproteota archaeon]
FCPLCGQAWTEHEKCDATHQPIYPEHLINLMADKVCPRQDAEDAWYQGNVNGDWSDWFVLLGDLVNSLHQF